MRKVDFAVELLTTDRWVIAAYGEQTQPTNLVGVYTSREAALRTMRPTSTRWLATDAPVSMRTNAVASTHLRLV